MACSGSCRHNTPTRVAAALKLQEYQNPAENCSMLKFALQYSDYIVKRLE